MGYRDCQCFAIRRKIAESDVDTYQEPNTDGQCTWSLGKNTAIYRPSFGMSRSASFWVSLQFFVFEQLHTVTHPLKGKQ